jgi:hypothetical protein
VRGRRTLVVDGLLPSCNRRLAGVSSDRLADGVLDPLEELLEPGLIEKLEVVGPKDGWVNNVRLQDGIEVRGRKPITSFDEPEICARCFLADLDVRTFRQRRLVDNRVHQSIGDAEIFEPTLREDVVDVDLIIEVGGDLDGVSGAEILRSPLSGRDKRISPQEGRAEFGTAGLSG